MESEDLSISALCLSAFVALLVFPSFNLFSQDFSLKISSHHATPPEYFNLLKPNAEIRDNTVLNESIVDLVDVYLTDSAITKKTERHQLTVVGGFTRMVGKHWITINWRKEKFVGSAMNGFRIPGGERFTEYDININVVPHLKPYIDLAFSGHARQKEMGKKKKKHDYHAPPFVYPDDKADLNQYHLHCELSPPGNYRSMINELFYPILPGNSASKHRYFGDENFTVGLYGAFISDCNHNCHPEIHPYEWLWWLNVHPDLDNEPTSKTWLIGLFREGSNRMPHWSPKPRTGEVSIPFVFPTGEKVLVIKLEHLVFSDFNKAGFTQLKDIPEDAMLFDKTKRRFSLGEKELQDVFVVLETNVPVIQGQLKFWFSDLNYDHEKLLLSGRLHLATSVDDLYTAKVKFSY